MKEQVAHGLMTTFAKNFGSAEGLLCSRAPGRVNLIGEHTDYNGGFVMPMAVDRAAYLFFKPAPAGPVRLWSENYGAWDEFDLADIGHNDDQPWSNYIRGVAHVLQDAGHALKPIEAVVHGDIPIGAGLSSSAALEVAAARAFMRASDIEPDTRDLALLCQRAENEFVGVKCGIMDQFVSVHAEADHCLLLDCRSLDHRLLPLDTHAFTVVVCNTMVHHSLGNSEYNKRRARCEEAARTLADLADDPSIEMLRDVSPETFADHEDSLDDTTRKRARHVISEIDRTRKAARALEDSDYENFGDLMNASHESLRDDYEVSCEELDTMVEIARRQPGCYGARMTGGGFGGCTVNLVKADAADAFVAAVAADYEDATGKEPEIYRFKATDGATVKPC